MDKMQTCENINMDIDPSSIVSPDYIKERFTVLGSLGLGIDGLVIKVLDNESNEVVALKSRIFMKQEMDEIKIGCMLAPTRPFTHSIIMPHEWAIVTKNVFLDGTDPLLPNWFDDYENMVGLFDATNRSKMENSQGLVFTMSLMDSTIEAAYPSLTVDEKRDILFELIIALESLRKIKLEHDDLHDRNILLKRTKEIRSYTFNGIQYIVDSQYMPVIIDFSHAYVVPTTESRLYFASDWIDIRTIFIKDIPDNMDTLFENADISILSHEFFRPLRERTVNPESLMRIFAPLESL